MDNITPLDNITAMQMLEVDQKFVLEVASGVRPPSEIAEDYGYSEEQWQKLKEFNPFIKAVEAKKNELIASGYTFRMKAAMGAEELLAEVFKKATEGDNVSFHTQLEALKFMARAAGLESPPREEAEVGARFSISINLGGGNTVKIGGEMVEKRPKIVENEPYYTPFDVKSYEIPFDASALFAEYN